MGAWVQNSKHTRLAVDGVLRRVPEQTRSWAKVESVLDAAGAMLIEESYEAVASNPAELCARADVTMGTFYTYFANTEAVLEGLRLRWIERVYKLADERLARPFDDWTEVCDCTVEFCVEFYAERAVRELWLRQGLTVTARNAERAVNGYVGRHMRQKIRGLGVDYRGNDLDDRVAVEIFDQLVRLGYAEGIAGQPDPEIIDRAKMALRAYVGTLIGHG